ncbi:MAG: HIT domain-containing protein [Waddliaceae bacterium]
MRSLNHFFGVFQLIMTAYSATASAAAGAAPPIYEYGPVQLEVARHPLSSRAVDIDLQQPRPLHELDETVFSALWKTRRAAENHFRKAGYDNFLCYAKLKNDEPPKWQVVPYSSSLPWYLDNALCRKIYSIVMQAQVLWRTMFPVHQSEEARREEKREFWHSLSDETERSGGAKRGSGALTQKNVIRRQIVYPDSLSSDDNGILVLCNYAPVRTGEKPWHYLLIPNPDRPAKDFSELDEQEYIKVMRHAQGIAMWAKQHFGEEASVHLYDKTGKIAGQTEPVYHAHAIITQNDPEEGWGKASMLFRLFFLPSRKLPPDELAQTVADSKEAIGAFLSQRRFYPETNF